MRCVPGKARPADIASLIVEFPNSLSGVFRLRCQKPQLGEHHLRGVSLHRLLGVTPLAWCSPELYPVSEPVPVGGGRDHIVTWVSLPVFLHVPFDVK